MKVGSRAIIIRNKPTTSSAEPLALIAGDPGSYLNGEPTRARVVDKHVLLGWGSRQWIPFPHPSLQLVGQIPLSK